jgi:hypothetical protein
MPNDLEMHSLQFKVITGERLLRLSDNLCI